MIITLCRIVYVILILQDDPFIILEQGHFPGRPYRPAVTVFIVIFLFPPFLIALLISLEHFVYIGVDPGNDELDDMKTVQNGECMRKELFRQLKIGPVGIGNDAFDIQPFFQGDGQKIIFDGRTPAVVDDIDDLAGDKVHDDESVLVFITDIEIYLIYGYIFRQGKPGKIHIAFEDQACAGIGDIELGSDIRCRSGKVPESIENEIGSDIGGMRIFIQERKGIVLRMSARFTDPSALMDDQIDVHGILGNGMIDPAGINALGMHAGITRRTESRPEMFFDMDKLVWTVDLNVGDRISTVIRQVEKGKIDSI